MVVNLKKEREDLGMSLRDVSEAIKKIKFDDGKSFNPSTQRIWDWENLTAPITVRAAEAFAVVYGISWVEIYRSYKV